MDGSGNAIRFVAGDPTDEEVAAVVAVLTTRAGADRGVTTGTAGTRGSGVPFGGPGVGSAWARPAHVRRTRPRSWAASRLAR